MLVFHPLSSLNIALYIHALRKYLENIHLILHIYEVLHGAILQGRNPASPVSKAGFPDRFGAAFFSPDRIAHFCSYFQNQYVLSSQQLLLDMQEMKGST